MAHDVLMKDVRCAGAPHRQSQSARGERRVIARGNRLAPRIVGIEAAILGVKLGRLDADNARRQAIAARYDAALAASGLALPVRRAGATHVFHQYVVRHPRRDELREALRRRAIGTLVHYPVPVHAQAAYRGRVAIGPDGLGESERAAREVLSLPIYPELAADAVERVAAALGDIAQQLRKPG